MMKIALYSVMSSPQLQLECYVFVVKFMFKGSLKAFYKFGSPPKALMLHDMKKDALNHVYRCF